MTIHEVNRLTASQMVEAMALGELSSVALVEACLAAIDSQNDELHALSHVYAHEALQAAACADMLRQQGAELGSLHGVPIVLKDNMELKGQITTGGSQVWSDRRSTYSATIALKLRQAGAIIVGKTHSVEFAMGGWGTNQQMGTPLNPWDRHVPRTPGGSSSGAAVAVAAGLVPWGLGTDTGGSIRTPAAWCGLTGLKVSTGRISGYGVLPLSPTLDTPGILCRDVADAALLYGALQGLDPHDRNTLLAPSAERMGRYTDARSLRFAKISEAQRSRVDADVLAAYDESLACWASAGATIVDLALPYNFEDVAQLNGIIMVSEGYALFADILDDPSTPMDEHVRKRLLVGKGMSAKTYVDALRSRERMCAEMAQVFDQVDAILTPTTVTAALPLSEVDEAGAPSHFSRFANFFNLPALALQNGCNAAGLPLSLQLIGPTWGEARLLDIGRVFQSLTDWHLRRPD